MDHALPEECYLNLPAEITPELAQAFPGKLNLLLQTQLLGRSVTDLEGAFRLILDLAGELVGFDRAVVLWSEDEDELMQLRCSRGFTGAVPVAALRDVAPTQASASHARPLLASPVRCTHVRVQNLLAATNASSLISLPLHIEGTARGALVLLRGAGAAYTPEQAHLLRVFSLSAEGLLENFLLGSQTKSYAFLDRATGLFNRRYFEQQLERELDRARRHSEPAAVLFVEVEGIGTLRTTHGHLAGEAALQEVARALEPACRKSDTLAHYHGDLLAVILPRTGKDSLAVVAQRVFAALQGPFLTALPGSPEVDLTFSLSAATYPEDAFSPTTLLELSEAGLGQARVQHQRLRFHQPPTIPLSAEQDEFLDPARMGLLSEPLLESSRLLKLFARICLDSVPADRVSIMVRDGEELVIEVAFGFQSQDEVLRTRRVRLDQANVSSWVAQRKQPLLVRAAGDSGDLPTLGGSAYTSASFFSYPLLHGDALCGVVHFSNPSDGTSFTQEQVDGFAPLATVIAEYLAMNQRFGLTQEQFLREALFSLVDATERQIPGMANHSREVAALAEATARRLGFDAGKLERLRVSARLHDLGKVTYRSRVLAADRAMSPREQALTQRHPLLGWKVLEEVPLRCVDREAVLYHHEREDGSGYLHKPGKDIPEAAKVLAVADVYQALTSPRAYRPAVSPAEARAYVLGQRDLLFDGRVVDALVASLEANGASA